VLVRRVARDGAFRAAAVAAVLGVLAGWAAGGRLHAAEGRLAAREARVVADSAQVAGAMARNEALASRRAAMGATLDRLRVLERGRDLWPRVLDGIAAALPSTAWIAGISEEREDRATGAVGLRVRGYAPSDAVAGVFERRLGEGGSGLAPGGTQTRAVRIGSVSAIQFDLATEARTDAAEVRP
jgi:hypothetical protein